MALRSTIDSPPTCDSGSAHSQRSCGSSPSATQEPSVLHSQLPYVSSTGFGRPLDPLVWTTIATASRSWRARSSTSAASSPSSGPSTTVATPRATASRSSEPRRTSIGTATAPSRRIACRATQNAPPGGSSSPTRSPGSTPRPARRRAVSAASPRSCAYVRRLTAGRSGWRAAARGSQASTSTGAKVACRRMPVNWTPAGEYTDIRYELDGEGIAKVTINRPEVRNAFRPQTLFELREAFTLAQDDPAVGVIILTGEGELAFCSGGDQRIRGDDGYIGDDAVAQKGIGRLNVLDLQIQMRRCPKPIVAMIAGYAIGGGHVLHVCCDLSIAAENARFGQTGPKVGSFDGGVGSGPPPRPIRPKGRQGGRVPLPPDDAEK